MADNETRRIGLPWYSRENYPDILDLMEDQHHLASTYDQWLMAAQNNEAVGQQAGLDVVRVMIEPAPFAQWCRERGLPPGGAARAAYAAEYVSSLKEAS